MGPYDPLDLSLLSSNAFTFSLVFETYLFTFLERTITLNIVKPCYNTCLLACYS